MAESARAPARIADKLEDIYGEEAHHLREEEQVRKRLFSQIIQKSSERGEERRRLERELQRRENQQNDLFWRNEEQRRQELSRKRRRDIEEARRANNSQHHQQLLRSQCEQPPALQKSFRDDLGAFVEGERRKKEERERYLREGLALEAARQERLRFERQLEAVVDHKKQQESEEQQQKREEFFSQWRGRHFQEQHPEARRLLDEANARREREGAQLEELIAVRGGLELNQRVAALRAAQVEEQAARKEQHVRQLKQQVEENTYKAAIDRYLALSHERAKMQELGRAVAERDQAEREQRREASNEHLSVLRGQMRPRSLLPEPDKVEFAGIGSPAHIGKIVHEDRLKQLKWIERNFLQEVKQL